MRILIVEDDEPKARNIKVFISELVGKVELRVSKSLRSGIDDLFNWQPNLVILDMTMPTYDIGPEESGGKPQGFGGKELMGQMERFDLNIPVVVVSQYGTFGQGSNAMSLGELDQSLKNEFGSFYLGAVHYQPAVEGWKEKLHSVIKDLI